MRNLVLIPSLIVLIGIIFIFGLTVGVYKIFPYEIFDSSADLIKKETSVKNNQFITQTDLNSLVKIDKESSIDQKRNDLIEFFWNVGSLERVQHDGQLPEVESDISDSRYSNFQNLKQIDKLTIELFIKDVDWAYRCKDDFNNKIICKTDVKLFIDHLKKKFSIIKPQNPLKITKIDFLNFQSLIQPGGFNENSKSQSEMIKDGHTKKMNHFLSNSDKYSQKFHHLNFYSRKFFFQFLTIFLY